MPDGAAITEAEIEDVLEEIRPFLKMAGGDVHLVDVDPADLQPSCTLRLEGSSSNLRWASRGSEACTEHGSSLEND